MYIFLISSIPVVGAFFIAYWFKKKAQHNPRLVKIVLAISVICLAITFLIGLWVVVGFEYGLKVFYFDSYLLPSLPGMTQSMLRPYSNEITFELVLRHLVFFDALRPLCFSTQPIVCQVATAILDKSELVAGRIFAFIFAAYATVIIMALFIVWDVLAARIAAWRARGAQ